MGGGQDGITCPQCSSTEADIIHMFARCPGLDTWLGEIENFLRIALKINVNLTTQLVLLGICDNDILADNHPFLFIAMAVARICIAAAWLDPQAPGFQQGLGRLLATYNLEKGVYGKKGLKARRRGEKIWNPLKQCKEGN